MIVEPPGEFTSSTVAERTAEDIGFDDIAHVVVEDVATFHAELFGHLLVVAVTGVDGETSEVELVREEFEDEFAGDSAIDFNRVDGFVTIFLQTECTVLLWLYN